MIWRVVQMVRRLRCFESSRRQGCGGTLGQDSGAVFCQWKHTAGLNEGYVTGLEPATNYPNPKRFERERGRVVTLQAGQTLYDWHGLPVHFRCLRRFGDRTWWRRFWVVVARRSIEAVGKMESA